MQIGIFGHYGNENLGDEAIVQATLENLQRLRPDAKFVQFSIRPYDSAERHGVEAFPIRIGGESDKRVSLQIPSQSNPIPNPPPSQSDTVFRTGLYRRVRGIGGKIYRGVSATVKEVGFLYRSFQRLKGTDVLLVAGSNQFLDNFGGVFGFPLTLLEWAALCRLTKTKLAFVSLGAGPINSRWSMRFIHAAIRLSAYTSFRDEGSKSLVLSDTWNSSNRDIGVVYPDLAHSLEHEVSEKEPAESAIVGINPMPMYDPRYWFEKDPQRYEEYINKVAELTIKLIEDRHQVFLFNTQVRDLLTMDDVLSRVQEHRGPQFAEQLSLRRSDTVNELMDVITDADIIVPTRFHGTVLALLAGRPVLGICYYRKAAELLTDLGQSDYYQMVDELDSETLMRKFRKLHNNYALERGKIIQRHSAYRDLLQEQYLRILRLLPDA